MKNETICRRCKVRRATEEHHALITKRMAQGCSKELKAHIDKEINKVQICDFCHRGRGHISRRAARELVLQMYSYSAIEEFFDEADKLVKVKFKRI